MRKKIIALAVSASVLAFSLMACGGGTTTTKAAEGETTAAAGDKYKVVLVTMDSTDQHWVNVDKGAKEVADANGVDYKWLAPDKKDDAQQIERVNNAVAEGANAILIAANGPDAVTKALEDAQAAGVKIIYVDSPANYPAEATFSTDNEAAGKTAGEEMLKALEAGGVKDGNIGIVNINSSTASTVAREKGFRAAFEGKGFTILETQYGEGDPAKSQDIADNYITQDVVGMFGANEGATVGVGNAIKASGKTIVGVGFDKSDAIKGLVKDGSLLATMAQNPDVMGKMGMEAAIKVLKGEKLAETNVDTGVSVLTKDNID